MRLVQRLEAMVDRTQAPSASGSARRSAPGRRIAALVPRRVVGSEDRGGFPGSGTYGQF
jgi:hypothetical protein